MGGTWGEGHGKSMGEDVKTASQFREIALGRMIEDSSACSKTAQWEFLCAFPVIFCLV